MNDGAGKASTSMRAGLVRVHRCVALGAGAFVVLVTLAGASLVFRDTLTVWITPAVAIAPRVPPPDAWQRVLEAARALEPRAASIEIVRSARADRACEVIVEGPRGGRHLFIDPHDASVVADGETQWLPFATFFRLHKNLFAGESGEYVVGAVGATLAFMVVSGLILWWPRRWKQALRVRWDGNRLALSYDLHRSAGALVALVLLLNALTGLVMVFDGVAAKVVNAVARAQSPGPIGVLPSAHAMKPLDEIVAAANRALPEGRVTRVVVRDGAPVIVRKRTDRDNHANGVNRIYVDPATGAVLRAATLERLAPGNAMFDWIYALHTGNLFGTPYKFALALAGLVPLLSLVTGLIVWRSKAAAKRSTANNPARATKTA